ncbi:MAG: flagellar biosynthesis protein FliQ [Lachnospiraceae bacterium]|nr:flagellar biosynthesis protein FliQ [Lachnospiraceae bacterium]MBR5760500.1 flagellar biosynthesis protein FliQ [Lachnospiraceae bacterium]MBR5993966.1 flagellar biosynthesis protein FliQ [Lachnospiraceae bacterium]MCR4679976.1 flagellar biosynthesis protein FliQ [Lachnospiraceae bacterium]
MQIDDVVKIVSQGLFLVIKLSAPILLISLIIGLVISIFQTVTSIQEQTLTFVPKIVCVFLGLMLLGNWMLTDMKDYMVELWTDFAVYIH